MDTSVTVEQPTRQAVAVVDRSARGRVTGKLRRAIEAMVWDAARRPEAAASAGLTDHSLRSALKKPHVAAYYRAECEHRRNSGRARRIQRLEEIADQSVNLNAAVAAIKTAETLGEGSDVSGARGAAAQSPGFIINIVNAPSTQPQPRQVEQSPAAALPMQGAGSIIDGIER